MAGVPGQGRKFDVGTALEQAMFAFWEHGYEGTSIADLTQAMGVTPPSLYATFGSKEDLYRQALDYAIEGENRRRAEALRGAASAYDAMVFYLHDVAESISQPGKPRGCIVSSAVLQHSEASASVARDVAARREAATRAMRERFDRAVSDGELPADTDTDSLARFYAAVVQGMSAQACDGACTARLKRIADIALSAWPGERTDGRESDGRAQERPAAEAVR